MNTVQTVFDPSGSSGPPACSAAGGAGPKPADAVCSTALADAAGCRDFVALLEAFRATGGTAPKDVVGRLLQAHSTAPAASLAHLLSSGQVFGFEWRGGVWIPMFQFNAADLSVSAAAQAVRAELPPRWLGGAVASWFAAPQARLNDQRPVDLLGSKLVAVLAAAGSWRTVARATSPRVRRVMKVAATV